MRRSARRASPALRLVALGATFAILVAACGGGSGKSASESTSPPSSEGTPKEGGNITYGLEGPTTDFCLPSAQLAISGIMVAQSIYDTLTEPDNAGNIEPYLAQSVDHNAAYDRWTITLRPGIKFQDGEPLDANAVVRNIDAWRTGTLLGFLFTNIADAQATSPTTVVVSTKVPWVAFPWYLWTTGRVGIAAPAQLDNATTCPTHMIGTGPFKLASFDPVSGEVKVVKNPDYWRVDSAGRRLPYLQSIDWLVQSDSAQRVNGLQGGQFDIIHDDSGVDQSRMATLSGITNYLAPAGYQENTHTLIDVSRPPFNDPTARKAVAEGVDVKALNELNNKGLFRVTNGLFDTKVLGYLPDPGYPAYNPNDARKLASRYKATHGGKFEFALQSTPDTQTVQQTLAIQEQLKQVGVTVDLPRPVDQATIISQAIGGSVGAFEWRNYAGADPDTMYVWFHGGSTVNFNHLNDPQVDADLDKGRSVPDPTVRKQVYQDFERKLSTDVDNLWGWHTRWSIDTKSNIHGIEGPNLPDPGGKPGTDRPAYILAGFHQIEGIWVS